MCASHSDRVIKFKKAHRLIVNRNVIKSTKEQCSLWSNKKVNDLKDNNILTVIKTSIQTQPHQSHIYGA